MRTAILQDLAKHIGYNSCAWGTQRIRANEARLGFNILWTVLFHMEPLQCSAHLSQYDRAMEEGEQLGIYCWMLLSHGNLLELLPLIGHHPDSAFFLFCRSEDITDAVLDPISSSYRWSTGTAGLTHAYSAFL